MSRPDLHPSAEPNPENSHRVPAAPRGPAALHHTRHGATSFWTAALLQHPSHQFLHQPTPRASARQSALRVAARADPESARPAVARALRGVPGRGAPAPCAGPTVTHCSAWLHRPRRGTGRNSGRAAGKGRSAAAGAAQPARRLSPQGAGWRDAVGGIGGSGRRGRARGSRLRGRERILGGGPGLRGVAYAEGCAEPSTGRRPRSLVHLDERRDLHRRHHLVRDLRTGRASGGLGVAKAQPGGRMRRAPRERGTFPGAGLAARAHWPRHAGGAPGWASPLPRGAFPAASDAFGPGRAHIEARTACVQTPEM